jgi:uncharacterized protein (DUF1501 family)
MSNGPVDRRSLLKVGGSLTILGAAAPFAMQMAAVGSAAGQTAGGYKALVCIFLFGGNDAHNMVLATDNDSFGRYFTARNTGTDPIALMPVGTAPTPPGQVSPITGRSASAKTPEAWGGVIPIVPKTPNPVPAGTNAGTRTFGLHPFMAPVQSLFNSGRLAVVANVGTLIQPITKAQYQAKSVAYPANLFSHNDQQSTWQAGAIEGAKVGWGGRMADMLLSGNGSNTLFTAISTAGNAVFLSGSSVVQYQITTNTQPAVVINAANGSTLFGSSSGVARVREIIQDTTAASLIADDQATVVGRSISAAGAINSAYGQAPATGVGAPPTFTNPITGLTETNSLATQLQAVAKMIASGASLGLQRQVFFVSLGGWDTHDFENITQPNLLAKVAQGLSYFDSALSNVGGVDLRSNVTTFTASDFNRTFTTNGDGTDHAWGSHHLVMGGAVNGKNIYGQYPTLGVDLGAFKNPDMAGAALVPTTSVDQYGATMGRWLGVSDANLATIFPNLQNFNPKYLGFL